MHKFVDAKAIAKANGGSFLGAFQMTCFIPLAYVSYYGINTWYFSEHFQSSRTAEERLFGPVSENVRKIGEVQIAFQAWDFVISLFNSELNSVEMLLHHAMTGLLCYWMLTIPYMAWYGVYFMGVCETSSLPLSVVDFMRFFPDYKEKYPLMNMINSLSFGAFFVWFRIIKWIQFSAGAWRDSLHVLKMKKLPVPRSVVVGVLVLNVFFTALQVVWCGLLLKEAKKMFFRRRRGRQEEGRKEEEEVKISVYVHCVVTFQAVRRNTSLLATKTIARFRVLLYKFRSKRCAISIDQIRYRRSQYHNRFHSSRFHFN